MIGFVRMTEWQVSWKVLYGFPRLINVIVWSFCNVNIFRSFLFVLFLVLHLTFLHYYLLIYFALVEKVLQVISFVHLLDALTVSIY